MENVTAIKESKFRKGLMRRIELIVNYLKVKEAKADNYLDIKPVFTRNIPSNDAETVQMVTSLDNILSKETLLAQIPFVEDVQKECEKINKENEELYIKYDYDNQTSIEQTSNKDLELVSNKTDE